MSTVYEPTLRVKDAMTHYVSTLEGVDEPATTIKKLTKQVLDPDGNNEAIQKARTIAHIWEQAAIERGYTPSEDTEKPILVYFEMQEPDDYHHYDVRIPSYKTYSNIQTTCDLETDTDTEETHAFFGQFLRESGDGELVTFEDADLLSLLGSVSVNDIQTAASSGEPIVL